MKCVNLNRGFSRSLRNYTREGYFDVPPSVTRTTQVERGPLGLKTDDVLPVGYL